MVKSILHFRVLKTVVAAFLAMVAGHLLLASWPIFIVLSACFCVRQTFMSSLKHFFREFKIALVATMIALLAGGFLELDFLLAEYVVYIPFLEFLVAALAIGAVVAVAQYFDWYNVILFGLLAVVYVLLVPAGERELENIFLARGFMRLAKIMVGSFMALVVDFLFSGFEYRRLFDRRLKQVLNQLDDMLDLFVEAIMFQSAKMMDQTLDLMVESQNLLNYVTNKLDDLEKELDLRGGEIHGFDYDRLSLVQDILREFRLISFQIEAGAVNYIELLRIMKKEGNEDAFPEANYARISSKGRKLAERVASLQQAVENEDPAYLEELVACELSPVDYRDLFAEMEAEDIRLLAVDTLSSISRIEYNLCRAARLVHKYLTEYS